MVESFSSRMCVHTMNDLIFICGNNLFSLKKKQNHFPIAYFIMCSLNIFSFFLLFIFGFCFCSCFSSSFNKLLFNFTIRKGSHKVKMFIMGMFENHWRETVFCLLMAIAYQCRRNFNVKIFVTFVWTMKILMRMRIYRM